jgi:hypothetical protein
MHNNILFFIMPSHTSPFNNSHNSILFNPIYIQFPVSRNISYDYKNVDEETLLKMQLERELTENHVSKQNNLQIIILK